MRASDFIQVEALKKGSGRLMCKLRTEDVRPAVLWMTVPRCLAK